MQEKEFNYLCKVRIDKSVPRDAKPWDRFAYPYLTLISQGHNLYKLKKIYHLNQLKSPIISKKITYLRYV